MKMLQKEATVSMKAWRYHFLTQGSERRLRKEAEFGKESHCEAPAPRLDGKGETLSSERQGSGFPGFVY